MPQCAGQAVLTSLTSLSSNLNHHDFRFQEFGLELTYLFSEKEIISVLNLLVRNSRNLACVRNTAGIVDMIAKMK